MLSKLANNVSCFSKIAFRLSEKLVTNARILPLTISREQQCLQKVAKSFKLTGIYLGSGLSIAKCIR